MLFVVSHPWDKPGPHLLSPNNAAASEAGILGRSMLLFSLDYPMQVFKKKKSESSNNDFYLFKYSGLPVSHQSLKGIFFMWLQLPVIQERDFKFIPKNLHG